MTTKKEFNKTQIQLGFISISLLISLAINIYAILHSGQKFLKLINDWHIILFLFVVCYIFLNLIQLLWNYRHKAEKTYHHISESFNDKNSGF